MTPKLVRCCSPILLGSWLVLCSGCSQPRSGSESFESVADGKTLLPGWELRVQGGVYRTGLTREAKDGNKALTFAGSGGHAELLTKTIDVPPNKAVSCSFWIQPKLFSPTSTARVALVEPDRDSKVLEQFVVTSNEFEDWKQYSLLYAPSDDTSHKIRPSIQIAGEGLLSVDGVEEIVREIVPEYRLKDGSFETSGKELLDWELSSENGKGKPTLVADTPIDGEKCLRLEGGGHWCVASWKVQIPAKVGRIFFHGYTRVGTGKAQLKIECYNGKQRLQDITSHFVTRKEWQYVIASCEPDLVDGADTLLLSLASEQADAYPIIPQPILSVDFDKLQVLVLKK